MPRSLDLGKRRFRAENAREREERERKIRKTWPSPAEGGEDPGQGSQLRVLSLGCGG